MFLTLEKLEARTRQLEAFRYVDMVSIAPMTSMEGGQGVDEVYNAMPDKIDGPALRLGDEFVGRDRYLWVQKSLTLPTARKGCEVVGVFDFGKTGGGHNSGFESLLYLDGEPYQGVDSNHNDVVFERAAGRPAVLTFMLWTGLEGGGKRKEQRHRIQRAEVGYLHKATDEFYYFSKAIYKTAKLLPDTDSAKHDLTAALNNAYLLINWDEDKFYTTIDAALQSLLAALDRLEKHTDVTVNVVGHTHIDVAWLWRLKHTREKAIRSFSTVLRLMEEFDEYIFLQTQPQLYKYVKNDCPALYEKIKAKIADGKWEADGGMWVEADCNISSGEALVRQFLHGISFLKEEFGTDCEYLWLPDVFGYSWALPQILKLCNIKTFMTTKISWNQYNSIPNDLFTWRGIDGSEILTYFITTPEVGQKIDARFSTYNGMISPRSVLGSWQKFRDKNISKETLIAYGYGDGGGGVNRNMLKMRRAMDKLPGLPRVKTTRAADFFERIHSYADNTDQYLHTWDGELYLEYHRGTYTSQAANKRYNRRLELDIVQGEWVSSLAYLLGNAYPAQILHDAWECVLLHQFHDIIPGSSIREVYEDSDLAYAKTSAEIQSVTAAAVAALSKNDGSSCTLLNPGSFKRRDLVLLPVEQDGSFTDETGASLPAQKSTKGWLVNVELEPLSAKVVHFTPGEARAAASPFTVSLDKGSVETPFYTIAWDENGNLTSIFDKRRQREVLSGKANVLELYEDKPLNYDNWDIDIFYTEKRETLCANSAPKLLECGSERVTLRFSYSYNKSAFTQDMILYSHCARIDFATKVDWHETNRLLKAAFPVDIRATKATYDIQFGHVERPTHWNTSWDAARFEVVGHKWADLSEADYGVSLLNNCKYGYNIKDNILRISLLKSTKTPDTEMDMGEQRFVYSLLPHEGTVVQADTIEEAVKLNLPIAALPGKLVETRRLVKLSGADVIIDAVKKCEKDDSIVLRVHECRGARGPLHICSDFALASWVPCNLLEENLSTPTAANEISTEISPFEIKTFKLYFTK